MSAIALQEPGSKLKGSVTDCTLPGETFIWLPFAGWISGFAVILPKPMGTGHGVGGGYPDASHVNDVTPRRSIEKLAAISVLYERSRPTRDGYNFQ
jgi:hypothetical protein